MITKHAEHGHQTAYRYRSKKGLYPLAKAWDWLSIEDVRKLAVDAYRSASFSCADPEDQVEFPREFFVESLWQAFECLLQGSAAQAGIATRSNAVHMASCCREAVPVDWRPQYPVWRVPEDQQEVVPQYTSTFHRLEG